MKLRYNFISRCFKADYLYFHSSVIQIITYYSSSSSQIKPKGFICSESAHTSYPLNKSFAFFVPSKNTVCSFSLKLKYASNLLFSASLQIPRTLSDPVFTVQKAALVPKTEFSARHFSSFKILWKSIPSTVLVSSQFSADSQLNLPLCK